jgi:hypothetical protein
MIYFHLMHLLAGLIHLLFITHPEISAEWITQTSKAVAMIAP